jgi:hypothetical protein
MGVANCTVIELAEEVGDGGRARIRLPPHFDSQEIKVLIAELEEVK